MITRKRTCRNLRADNKCLRLRLKEAEAALSALSDQCQSALLQSEQRYRSLFQNLLDGFSFHSTVFDGEGRLVDYIFLETNSAFETLTGLRDLAGKRVTEVLPGLRESRPELFEIYGRVVTTGRPERFEIEIPALGKWFSISVYRPQLEHFVAVFDDISARKRAEKALLESEQRFQLALKNSPVSVAIQDRDLVYQWAYNQLFRSPDEIVGKSDADLFPPEEAAHILRDKRRVLDDGVEVHVEHWLTSNGRRLFLDLSYEPLRNPAGEITGIGITVVNLTRQKLAEEALKQGEERYRLLADTMLQGVVHQDADGRIIAMNPAAERILGKTRGQYLGRSTLHDEHHCIRENGETFPERDHPAMAALRSGLPVRGVIMGVFNPKLRSHRWIGIDAVPVVRPGLTQPTEVYTVFGDITERRQAQEELRLTTERFQVALKGSPIAAFNQNLDLRYTWIYNPGLVYGSATVLGKLDSDLFERAEDAEVTEGIKREVIRTGTSRRQEVLVHARGGERCYDLIVDPLLDGDGRVVGVTCAAIDLTERKQAEEELRQKEERLRLALEAARMATWDWYIPSGKVIWNEMHFLMLGYRSGEVEPSYEAWASRIHPDDAEMLQNRIQQCLVGNQVYSAEFRTLWPNGTVRWLEARGEFEYDANHESRRFYGVMLDITERKRIEAELREWNVELENRVADRTAQLAASVENLKVEIEERKNAEESVRLEATERLRAVEALREKEQMLIQQSRLAAMGEMIGNIAHQWRQPLNLLGLTAQQTLLFYDVGEFDRKFLAENVEKQMEIILHMSQTIDDFRNYFKPDRERTEFKVQEVIANTVSLLRGSLHSYHIALEVVAKDDPVIYGYPNEFAQVLLNIVINAKDILVERGVRQPRVNITSFCEEGRAVVTVADNGGGVPQAVAGRIFDPYFTTKGPQGGTGVGLFMSKTIIEKNMGGRLSVRNLAEGAEFRVEV